MTVRQLLDQVRALRKSTFSDDQLLTWLNEVEGHIMTDVLLWPIGVCYEYVLAATVSASVSFPDAQTMVLEQDAGLAPGGTVTLADLVTYANNNGGPYTVLTVSDDGLTVGFADDTFTDVGTEPETGTLTWDGNGVQLLVLPPHDKLYRPYVLAQIAFAQEEWDGYQNYMALYNEYLGEYTRWFGRTYHPAMRRRGERYARRWIL